MTLELLQEMLPPPLYETELPEGEAMPLFQKVISLPRIHGLKRGEAPPPGGLIFLLREGLLRIASRRDVTHQVTKYFVKSPQLFGELALMAREKEYDIAEGPLTVKQDGDAPHPAAPAFRGGVADPAGDSGGSTSSNVYRRQIPFTRRRRPGTLGR